MNEKLKIRGVIFDMDGTIVDVPYDWDQIKKELNTGGEPILNYLDGLKEPEKTKKWDVLEAHEKHATQNAVLKQGISSFLQFLKKRGLLTALVTNNSKDNVFYLLHKFGLKFDHVVTRESGLWKPSAEPFFEVFKTLSLHKENCCVVGDSAFDVIAARRAGIESIFIINEDIEKFKDNGVEVYVSVKKLKSRMKRLLS
ncbi:MAG: HAD-IA family hydrolase [Candidatus Aminicenantes bacterium]|nr:HAD-IA family hydrolase [Candidatus Aminicenantes bacterium]